MVVLVPFIGLVEFAVLLEVELVVEFEVVFAGFVVLVDAEVFAVPVVVVYYLTHCSL